jgi:hypothetical protein
MYESAESVSDVSANTLTHVGAISNADSVYHSIYRTEVILFSRKGGSETSAPIHRSRKGHFRQRHSYHSIRWIQNNF